MSAALAVQTAIGARLVATAAVTTLVPAANIVDSHGRPPLDPSIMLGEDQETDENRIARNVVRIYSTLHVWKKEPSLEGVKAIAGAVRMAILISRLEIAGFHCGDCRVPQMRYLRDPDGETSHGIVAIETPVSEVAP